MLTCPSRDEIKAIDRDLELSFIDDLTAQRPLVCTEAQGSVDLTEVQWGAYQALRMMKATEFIEPLPWTDSLYDWFVHAVDGIDYDGTVDNSYCCRGGRIVIGAKLDRDDGSLPSLIFWYRNKDRIWSVGGGESLVSHIQLLVHEARHNEGVPHTCGSDDETFEEMGSWAYAAMVVRWYAEKFQSAGFFGSRDIDGMRLLLQRICKRFCKGSCPVWEQVASGS